MRFAMLTLALVALAGMGDFARAQNQPPPGNQPPAGQQPGTQPPPKDGGDPKLIKEATGLLQKYCASCHGPGGTNEGGVNYLFNRSKLVENTKVVPGDLELSKKKGIWKRLFVKKDMPPEDVPPYDKVRPTEKEMEIIGAWIKDGAHFQPTPTGPAGPAGPAVGGREFVGVKDGLESIHGHLQQTPQQDRPFMRYFSLTNLHNNPTVTDGDMRLARGALVKVINSVSWENQAVQPRPVDKNQTIYAMDIRELKWDRTGSWKDILSRYPYGLTFKNNPDQRVADLDDQINKLSGAELPWIRADWFVTNASKPPLYHALLQLPKTAGELEKKLGVDFEANFLSGQLMRGGFTASGVSGQNRLVERHRTSYGAYWKSYDFKKNNGRGDILRYPLGPKFAKNPYNDTAAFEHDGGEMIFHLPNGLQGYYLTDNKGARIDEGPIDVVRDTAQTSGTPVIVNGLSCMHCHNKGPISFNDSILDKTSQVGAPRETLRQLHPAPEQMKKVVQQDEDRFMRGYEQAASQYMKSGDEAAKGLAEFKEPVGVTARRYIHEEIDISTAAAELGLKDKARLSEISELLRERGLLPLIRGGTIKRESWDSRTAGGRSAFQAVASALDVGEPLNISRKLKN